MEHQIKLLAQAITHHATSHLVESHVKGLKLEDGHLAIYVDNANPLHDLESADADGYLKNALEKIYGSEITYEFRLYKEHMGAGERSAKGMHRGSKRR